MTQAYVDSASMHCALGGLLIDRQRLLESPWERQLLLETTYLLMHQSVRIVPGVGPYNGPSGPYEQVKARFALLEDVPPLRRKEALAATKRWASRNVDRLRNALHEFERDPVGQAYANNMVECFWVHHVLMYGTLFNRDFIKAIARVLGCTEQELIEVNDLTADVRCIERWIREGRRSDEARLGERAYWITFLLRGRYHEELSKKSELQLVEHPMRALIQQKLRKGTGKPVLRSEEIFTRILVGAALSEKNPQRRIQSWVDGVYAARCAVDRGEIELLYTSRETRAEKYAIDAAKKLGIGGHSRFLSMAINVTASLSLPTLLAVSISPWVGPLSVPLGGLISAVAPEAYCHWTGKSFGDGLARVARSTRERFRTLAELAPGRVERHLRFD